MLEIMSEQKEKKYEHRYRLNIIYTNGLLKSLTVRDWDHTSSGLIWYRSVEDDEDVTTYIPMEGIQMIKSRDFYIEVEDKSFEMFMNAPECARKED